MEATITTPVISIKNPLSGCIQVPAVGEIILDDENAKGKICVQEDPTKVKNKICRCA